MNFLAKTLSSASLISLILFSSLFTSTKLFIAATNSFILGRKDGSVIVAISNKSCKGPKVFIEHSSTP